MKSRSQAKHITREGTRIYYWRKKNSKTTVILLSGSGMNHSTLEKLQDEMHSKGYGTLIVEQRGMGYSDPGNYDLEDYVKDVAAVLKKEKIRKPFFVAHSFSFMVAVAYTASTGNARAIVGISAAPDFKSSAPHPILFWIYRNVLLYRPYLSSRSRKRDVDLSRCTSDSQLFWALARTPSPIRKEHGKAAHKIIDFDVRELMKSIHVPILYIYGKKDMLIARKPRGRKIIMEGGHALPTTHSKVLAKHIDTFFYSLG